MPYQIQHQDGFIPDKGDNGFLYPLPKRKSIYESYTLYNDNTIFDIHQNQAAIIGVFNQWFLGHFKQNYFKSVNISTQFAAAAFKSFMASIYKIDKPYLIINPQTEIDIDEDSVLSTNMLVNAGPVEPDDRLTAELAYSRDIFRNELVILSYQPLRMKFKIDLMVMETTYETAQNARMYMTTRILHKARRPITRTIPYIIPLHYIKIIAKLHNMDWRSDEFITYMNTRAIVPIIKRVHPGSGNYTFHMLVKQHVDIESTEFPVADSKTRTEAIDLGGRVADNYDLHAEVPGYYRILIRNDKLDRVNEAIPEPENAVTYISPYMSDMPWPLTHGSYHLINRTNVEFQRGDDPRISILDLIADNYPDAMKEIHEYLKKHGMIDDLIRVRVFPNGKMEEIGSLLDNNGTLTILNPLDNTLYSINTYLNLGAINFITEDKLTHYAGSVKTDMI